MVNDSVTSFFENSILLLHKFVSLLVLFHDKDIKYQIKGHHTISTLRNYIVSVYSLRVWKTLELKVKLWCRIFCVDNLLVSLCLSLRVSLISEKHKALALLVRLPFLDTSIHFSLFCFCDFSANDQSIMNSWKFFDYSIYPKSISHAWFLINPKYLLSVWFTRSFQHKYLHIGDTNPFPSNGQGTDGLIRWRQSSLILCWFTLNEGVL